uniref:Uncharacterized protein n=1 Tax=viral metagenome TaxID=1070528 RepID=A0A6C0H864_9ZZZZ
MNIQDKISTFFNSHNLVNLQHNHIIHMIIYLFLISYVVSIQPKLPKFIETLFKYTLFRLICISYILWRANDNLLLSTLLTITFLFIVHYTNKNHILKLVEPVKKQIYTTTHDIVNLVEPVKKQIYNDANNILNSVEPIKQQIYTTTHDIVNLVEPYKKNNKHPTIIPTVNKHLHHRK